MSTESWTYLGVRVDDKGKPIHAWRDSARVTRLFTALKASVVGGGYSLDVEHKDGDGVVVSPSTMKFMGVHAPDADVIQLEHKAAQKRLEAARLERSGSRHDALEEAIAPLLELAGRTKSHASKAALVDYVTRRIYSR